MQTRESVPYFNNFWAPRNIVIYLVPIAKLVSNLYLDPITLVSKNLICLLSKLSYPWVVSTAAGKIIFILYIYDWFKLKNIVNFNLFSSWVCHKYCRDWLIHTYRVNRVKTGEKLESAKFSGKLYQGHGPRYTFSYWNYILCIKNI